ncbi:PDDEXK nuclease domain-containing protein [Belliella sp. DSM 107340]|uniref:PDDEXK nuclease domain-containing protein n=1 Tax=Belliella calami TaxID=2923436 RepID=A0ABS9UTE7_9BACT|nr:PDDEXK nuclease domain-containing protein [Belliella calami]MCH7399884.1 PDDEXK nuclease domain-containing protein [Belliella calami]
MQLDKNIVSQIQSIINNAQERAIRSVDFERVLMYWQIGQVIFEEEQNGKDRAAYGTFLIKSIAETLKPQFGSGFSKRQLHWCVQFYKIFPNVNALRTQLNWTQYRLLIQIDNEQKREFYLAEATKNNWSARQLERQINSLLFERLLKSNNINELIAVANSEKTPIKPLEIIKDPMILEFLGLKKEASYYEKDLETAIIDNLQDFLLELGNGFSFIARQKRIHLDDDDFFIDLVFYNRLLQSFVLIEIKTGKLTHQDLGQLQMYVNYYDQFEKQDFENPTIGILLCTDKNDSVVKISLPKDNKTIMASKYQLYLPKEEELRKEIQRVYEQKTKEDLDK